MQKSIRHQSHAYQSEAEQLLSFFSLVSLFIMFAPPPFAVSLSSVRSLSKGLKLEAVSTHTLQLWLSAWHQIYIENKKCTHTHMLSPTHACTCNTYVRRNIKVRYCVIENVSSYAGDAEHGLILAIIVFDNRRCPFELYWDAMLFLVRPDRLVTCVWACVPSLQCFIMLVKCKVLENVAMATK